MAAHEHAEMIKAKADNMELVIFCKDPHSSKWRKQLCQDDMDFDKDIKYFLCSPKHEKVCLHWLNGGEAESYFPDINGWGDMDDKESFGKWTEHHPFMDTDRKTRIKPRKEKRWIAVNNKDDVARGKAYTSKELAKESVMFPDDWQFIEMEVEV